MSDISGLFPSLAVSGAVAAERAIAELRAGRPIVVSEGVVRLLVFPAENLDAASAYAIDRLAPGRANLILSAQRLSRLGVERGGPLKSSIVMSPIIVSITTLGVFWLGV